MTTSYRHFYKPGDVVIESDTKADELISRGSAVLIGIEKEAPVNKEVVTERKVNECPHCNKGYATERSLKAHITRSHK